MPSLFVFSQLCFRHPHAPTNMSSIAATIGSPTEDKDDSDLILVVGADRQELRASSTVLSAHSPVFAAMFGPHFAEGKQLRDPTRNSPVQVWLPEDDFDGMRLLNGVLHNEGMILGGWCYGGWAMHISELETFATHAAKYLCQDTARARAGEWVDLQVRILLGQLNAGASIGHGFVQVLKAMDQLNDHKRFANLTNVLGRKGWTLNEAFTNTQDEWLVKFLDHYEKSKYTARLTVCGMLDQVGENVACYATAAAIPPLPGCGYRLQCGSTQTLACWLLNELALANMWPPELRPVSLPVLFNRLQRFRSAFTAERCYEGLWSCLRWNYPGQSLPCTTYKIVKDTQDDIETAQRIAREMFVGVCLECLRASDEGEGVHRREPHHCRCK
ncbi:hypothetical protein HII31_01070 [Pseudocercospora fuligena]|uniref:BTB domain-containing protein n=1 Tax=Pseudocercospora fuligena TaxID=685502 RepID=A0A8H6RUF0_9PEZI|nr:hypothetical protein HII31_01070 [Pseudocercospora fuligena]